jgi:hypothetical protein
MRRAVDAFVRGLPLDDRSRRVLDETLLDWELEAVGAPTPSSRFVVELRSLLAVARAFVFVSVRDLPRVPAWWLLGRLALFGVVPVAILMSFSRDPWPIQTLRLGIKVLAGWLPLAFFYSIAWRPAARRPPILAVAVCGSALIAAFVLYISPHVMWRFYELQFRQLNRPYPAAPPVLIWHWWEVAEVCGPIALTPALIVFAEAFRNLSRWRRFVLSALAPFLYVVLSSIVWLVPELTTGRAPTLVFPRMVLFALGLGVPIRFPFADAAAQVLFAVVLLWLSTRLTRPESAEA